MRSLHATCATLAVPLDHSGRSPGRLRLQVAMVGPAHPARGVLVFLTGGPGQPGARYLPTIDIRLGSALDGYRLVMLDQRGTGRDALSCPALQRAVGASDLTVPPLSALRDCASRIGSKRRFFTTADTAADLDQLRAALGVDRWTLDGVSYGTFTAERYALAHPAHVARLVLDSVVPQEGINPFQLGTIHAVPRVLRAACATRRCGSDPAADLAAVIRARHDGPALLDTLVTLSIAEPAFRAVPRALSEARAGRPQRLDRLVAAVHRGDSLPATFLSQGLHDSTLCEDYPQPWGGPAVAVPQRLAAIRSAAHKLTSAGVYPFDLATANRQRRARHVRELATGVRARHGATAGSSKRPGSVAGRRSRPLHADGLGAGRGGSCKARPAGGRARRRPLGAAAGEEPRGAPGASSIPAGLGADPRPGLRPPRRRTTAAPGPPAPPPPSPRRTGASWPAAPRSATPPRRATRPA